MTSQRAYWFAKILEQAPSIFDSPPDLYKSSGAIESKSPGDTTYTYSSGFNANYGSPASRHGRYMTLSDLRMFYYLGTEVAKYKLYGWQATRTYNNNFNNNDDQIFSGEGKPICRHRSGYKMVKYGYSNGLPYPTLPYSYKQDQAWKPLLPTPKWKLYEKSKDLIESNNWNTHYEISTMDIPLNFIKTWIEQEWTPYNPPRKTVSLKYVIPIELSSDCIVSWPIDIVKLEKASESSVIGFYRYSHWLHKLICGGNAIQYSPNDYDQYYTSAPPGSSFSISISQYSDVYENIDHKNSVIPIGYYGEELPETAWKTLRGGYYGIRTAWSNNILPLSKGTWYLYLEFENPMLDFWRLYNFRAEGFVLPLYLFTPTALWPTATK